MGVLHALSRGATLSNKKNMLSNAVAVANTNIDADTIVNTNPKYHGYRDAFAYAVSKPYAVVDVDANKLRLPRLTYL